jgi:hypothetical protein
MLVFDELYPESLTIPQIAEQIKQKNRQWGVSPVYVIDPSARNRSLVNAESVEGAFAREGIYPSPGQNDRLTGVLQMRARLEQDALLVTENCVNWLFEAKRWLVAKDEVTEEQTPTAKGSGGSFATIGPDHLMDPTRYVCMERLYHVMAQASRPAEVWTPGKAPSAAFFRGGQGHAASGSPMGNMS